MRVGALPVSSASGSVLQPQPAAGWCHAKGSGRYSEPDPKCTPGALNPAVTRATIDQTICVSGWTGTVRPSTSVTEPEKLASMVAYGAGGLPGGLRIRPSRLTRAGRRGQRPAEPVARAGRLAEPQGRHRERAAPDGVRRRHVARRGAAHHRDRLGFLGRQPRVRRRADAAAHAAGETDVIAALLVLVFKRTEQTDFGSELLGLPHPAAARTGGSCGMAARPATMSPASTETTTASPAARRPGNREWTRKRRLGGERPRRHWRTPRGWRCGGVDLPRLWPTGAGRVTVFEYIEGWYT